MHEEILAMAKRYTDSKSLGGSDRHTVKSPLYENKTPDLTIGGIPFVFKSSLTPTEGEIQKGRFYASADGNGMELEIKGSVGVDGIYGVRVGNIAFSVMVFICYRAGEYTLNIDGNVVTGIAPKPGMYWDNTVTAGGNVYLSIEWETIHLIDPKFLPGVCLPVVELSLSVEEGLGDLNEGDSAKIEELNGQPFILRAFVGSGDLTECGIVSVVSLGNIKIYTLETPMSTIAVQNANGKWETVRAPKE